MSRKQPVGYEVRRPLTLWGKKREIGEYLPVEEVASMARIESMVRSGRFIEIFEDQQVKPAVRRGRPPKAVADAHKPKAKKTKAKKAVVTPVVEEKKEEALELVVKE